MSGTLIKLGRATLPSAPRAPNLVKIVATGGGGGGTKPPVGGGWKPPPGGGMVGGGGGLLKVRVDPIKMPELKEMPVSAKARIGDKIPCLIALAVALKKVTDDMQEIAEDDDLPESMKAKQAVEKKKDVDKAMKDFQNCLTSGAGGMSLTDAALAEALGAGQSLAKSHIASLNESAAELIKAAKRVSAAEE